MWTKSVVDEEQDIPNMHEKSRKVKVLLKCGKYGVMGLNVECLGCSEVEALGYLQYLIWDTVIGMLLPRELVQQSCNFT